MPIVGAVGGRGDGVVCAAPPIVIVSLPMSCPSLRVAAALLLALLVAPVGVRAASPDRPRSAWPRCGRQRAIMHTPGLLAVIAKVESGRATSSGAVQPWPWTVDADGQGIFFATKEQAVAWSRRR